MTLADFDRALAPYEAEGLDGMSWAEWAHEAADDLLANFTAKDWQELGEAWPSRSEHWRQMTLTSADLAPENVDVLWPLLVRAVVEQPRDESAELTAFVAARNVARSFLARRGPFRASAGDVVASFPELISAGFIARLEQIASSSASFFGELRALHAACVELRASASG